MAFAEKTKVPISKTKADIENLVTKYKCTSFASMTSANHSQIAFQMQGRNILFKVNIPDGEQKARSRWRALLLVIKAKLESVEAGIEEFEDAFLANIVMPGGQTVSEMARPAIEIHYSGNTSIPLLPNN